MELDWLKRWALYSPNNTAIKDGDTGREFSYIELFNRAHRGSLFLRSKFGISKGDRVAVIAANELEYVILFFALQRLGAILVPINFRLTPREAAHIVTDSSPKLIVFQEDYRNIIENLVVTTKPAGLLFQGANSFSEALEQPPHSGESFFEAHDADEPTMILYTSGTTGAPKGVILTHQTLFWNSLNTTLRLNISQADSTLIFLPFFHTGGWNVLTTPLLHRGAKVVFLKKFDPARVLALSEQEKITILFGVPTTMDMMAKSSLFDKTDLSSIRYAIVGGEPMPLDLIRVWDKKGIPIRQGYGLTEFGPNVFSLNEEDSIRKIGSIGFPNFYIEAKIVDSEGGPLKDNEIGELALRGPACMQGYWHNEKSTLDTLKDGWLYTGDLVRRDPEGYYYVVGRKKDMFISGGENIYPPEIEQVLRHHPEVLEAAVIGVPDKKWGEVGKAFIVKKSASLSLEELQSHCLENLAKYKIPKHFVFLASLPKGDSGKILKRSLADL